MATAVIGFNYNTFFKPFHSASVLAGFVREAMVAFNTFSLFKIVKKQNTVGKAEDWHKLPQIAVGFIIPSAFLSLYDLDSV